MRLANTRRKSEPAAFIKFLRSSATQLLLLMERPLMAGLIAMLVYGLYAALYPESRIWDESVYPYYNYLADSFLHGELALRELPARINDLSYYEGEFYLYWSPFPAVLMMPLVALVGPHFSDVIFTVAVGGLNVGLIALLLRRAVTRELFQLTPEQRGLLVLMFAFGTVHFMLAPYGRVQFTCKLISFSCSILAYLATLSWERLPAFLLTGLALAGALLSRNHVLFVGLWPVCYLLYRHRHLHWGRLAGYVAIALAPILLGFGLLALYNLQRFGSPLDNGLDYHQMAERFQAEYALYGPFHVHYLPSNLYYQYVAYPLPIRKGSFEGGSLFLLTPPFFAALWALYKGQPRWMVCSLFLTIMVVNIPILLLMGTGWVQFGPQYTIDFTVPLLLLTAIGLQRWPLKLTGALVMISIFHYAVGSYLLGTII